MFLIPLAGLTSSWKKRITLFAVGFGTYFLSILPFLGSAGFRRTALVAGQTMKSMYLQFPISGGEAIIPYLALLVFFGIVFMVNQGKVENLWKRYFMLLLLFFVFTHYHPQWFLWFSPFLIFDILHSNYKNWIALFIALFSFFGLVTFFDPGLSIGLFAPISPSLYRSPGIWDFLHINLDINYARSILQTLFVGAGIYWFYQHKDSLSL